MTSTVEKILAEREKRKSIVMNEEDLTELRRAVNGVAGSECGMIFMKALVKACRMYAQTDVMNGVATIVDASMRSIWLAFRDLISPELLAEIECYNQAGKAGKHG